MTGVQTCALPICIINGTGGFQATAWCDEDKTRITALDLSFIVEHFDVGDE